MRTRSGGVCEMMKVGRLVLGCALAFSLTGFPLRAQMGSTGQTDDGRLSKTSQPASSQIATSPATASSSRPAEEDSDDVSPGPAAATPALTPQILPAPTSEAEIAERLEIVKRELESLRLAAPPASAPATSPADEAARKADPKVALADVLRQYRVELNNWKTVRSTIADLKSSDGLARLSADLDKWEKQRQTYAGISVSDAADDLDAKIKDADRRYTEENARLQELGKIQAAREQQLTALPKQKAENEKAIKETSDALGKYLADLSVRFGQLKSQAEREPLLLRKRALEWDHSLRLLRAAAFSDQSTALEVAQQQGTDRIAALTKYVAALRQYQLRLADIRVRFDVEIATRQLARTDLVPYMRTNWEVRLAIAQGVADFQKVETAIRDLFPVAEVDRLEQRAQRGLWYLNAMMESLDRRSGESILEIYRRIGVYLAKYQDSLKSMRASQDRLYEQMRIAQDRRDFMMERTRNGRDALEQQIKSLKGDEVVKVREIQAHLTDDLNVAVKTKIDPLMTDIETFRDRYKKSIPALDEFVTRLQRDRAKLYRTYLVVRGRSLLWPDQAALSDEWVSVRTWKGKPVEEIRTRRREVANELAVVSLAGWGAGAGLAVLTGCLAWRCRTRLRDWARRKEEALLVRMESVSPDSRAAVEPVLEVKRFEVQAARALAGTAGRGLADGLPADLPGGDRVGPKRSAAGRVRPDHHSPGHCRLRCRDRLVRRPSPPDSADPMR